MAAEFALVPTEDIDSATFIFTIDTNFNDANEIKEQIRKQVAGIVNTSGGQIQFHSPEENEVDPRTLDAWLDALKGILHYLPRNVFLTCLSFETDNFPIRMTMTKSSSVVTVESHMYMRTLASNEQVNDAESIKEVMLQETRPGTVLKIPSKLKYGSIFSINEGPNVEFKMWEIKQFGNLRAQLNKPKNKRSLFSIPNMSSGGDMFLGIGEEKKINAVKGLALKESDEQKLNELLIDMLHKSSIWGHTRKPDESLYSLSFIEITDCTERRRLVRIHLNHCPGGVFEREPESYHILDDGTISRMKFEEWRSRILNTNINNTTAHPTQTLTDHIQFDTEPASSKALEHEKGLKNLKSELKTEQVSQHESDRADEEINTMLSARHNLSFSKHNNNWKKNLKTTTLDVEQSIRILVKESMIIRPEKPINLRLSDIPPHTLSSTLAKLFNHIESIIECKSFGFASAKLPNIMGIGSIVQPPKYHKMDVMVTDELCNIHVWSVVDTDVDPDEKKSAKGYVLTLGRLLKKKILTNQKGSVFLNKLTVQCHIYALASNACIFDSEAELSTVASQLSHMSLDSLRVTIARLLLERRIIVKTPLGEKLDITLSAQQLETTLYEELEHFHWIEGPPGSGKTYLALYICSKYAGLDVGYLCTTKPFWAFVQFQHVCKPYLVQNEKDLLKLLDDGVLQGLKCLIADDIHNLSCQRSTWNRLFQAVLVIGINNFFMFADSQYQTYRYPDAAKTMKECLRSFCDEKNLSYHEKALSDVHRNSRKIVSFMKTCYEDSEIFPDHGKIRCSHEEDGDDVEIKRISNLRADGPNNGLVQYLTNILSKKSYAADQIAILVDGIDATELAKDLRRIVAAELSCETIHVHDASRYPLQGIVIDTLLNFCGMDRELVICIPPTEAFMLRKESTSEKLEAQYTLLNPKYKAFIASRGIYKVVVVLENQPINVDIARQMGMNNLPLKNDDVTEEDMENLNITDEEIRSPKSPTMMWHLRGTSIRDVCFLARDDDDPVVLYVTSQDTLLTVNMSMEPITLHLDTTGIREHGRANTTVDHCGLVLAYAGGEWDFGPWYWTTYSKQTNGWTRQVTHRIQERPHSVGFTMSGDIIMVIWDHSLRRFTTKGDMLWQVDGRQEILNRPYKLAVDCRDMIFTADSLAECVQVFNSQGQFSHGTPHAVGILDRPRAICATQGDNIMVGHGWYDKDQVTMLSKDGNVVRHVVESPGRVWSLSVYQNRFMLVGTEKGVLMFNIESFLV